jgi:hypothetical protein
MDTDVDKVVNLKDRKCLIGVQEASCEKSSFVIFWLTVWQAINFYSNEFCNMTDNYWFFKFHNAQGIQINKVKSRETSKTFHLVSPNHKISHENIKAINKLLFCFCVNVGKGNFLLHLISRCKCGMNNTIACYHRQAAAAGFSWLYYQLWKGVESAVYQFMKSSEFTLFNSALDLCLLLCHPFCLRQFSFQSDIYVCKSDVQCQ